MLFREIHNDELERYDDFIKSNPYGDLLQSPAWSKVKKDGWDIHFMVIEEKNEILAAITVMIRRIPYIRKNLLYIPRGPILKDPLNELFAMFYEIDKQDN